MDEHETISPQLEGAVTQRDLLGVLERVLTQLTPSRLRDLALDYEVIEKGRVAQAKPLFLMQVIKAHIAAKFFDDTPPNVLSIFEYYAPAEVRCLQQLSLDAIKENYYSFIVHYGKAEFLFYLLCDTDADRRAWAMSKMPASEAGLPSPEKAQEQLAHRFEAFLRLNNDAPMASRQSHAQMTALRTQLEEAQKAAKRDRREAFEKHQEELRALKQELATAKFNVEEFKRRVEEAERLRDKEIKEREIRLQHDLSIKQIELFRGWLRPAIEAEIVAHAQEGDLFEAIDKAIELQTMYDRSSQTTQQLQAELEHCYQKRDQLVALMRTAQRRHPMLEPTFQRLKSRIEMIEATLPQAAPSPMEASLMEQITTAQEKNLPQVLALIELSERMGLVAREAVNRLRTAYNQRVATWEDLALLEVEDNPIELRNPELRDALRGRGAMMLFLDGHNILNGLGRYRQRRGKANTHEKMRERVQKDVIALLHHLPLSVAHLVWDGPKMETFTLSDNVNGHYSGGEGEHKADHYILDQIKYYREKQVDIPCVLVTDDNDFGGSARRLGAKVCRLHDFEAFMNIPYHG
jgi:hypothetical protein